MATRRSLTVPTAAALSGSLRVPASDPSLPKTLLRLSRPSLLALIQAWLQTRHQSTCGPLLGDDESGADAPYDVAQTLEELREVYRELRMRRGGKREVVDRVLEGDWRHGVSLRQLAMLDVQILLDHPASHRWMARRLERIVGDDSDRGYKPADLSVDDEIPRLRGHSFVESLQKAIGSMVKAHYYLTRLGSMPISLLRITILDSPYNTQASLEAKDVLKTGETLFVAFPDHCPYVYLSSSARPAPGASAALGLRKIVTDTIARALSRPQKRYTLKSTGLIARTLSTMTSLQGATGDSNALGGWSIFAAGSVEASPLVPATGYEEQEDEPEKSIVRKRVASEEDQDPTATRLRKRRCQIAQKRFGRMGIAGDGRGIERLDVRLENLFSEAQGREALGLRDTNLPLSPESRKGRQAPLANQGAGDSAKDDGWRPNIALTFHGSHVFAGVRGLVEAGAIDGVRMPGWMTGEHGVAVGVVRDGLLKGRLGQ